MRKAGLFALLVSLSVSADAQTITETTSGLDKRDGFIPLYWDGAKDTMLFEVPAFGEDVLYYVSTAHGLGSVELGLDRGVTTQTVIRFQIHHAVPEW